MAGDANIKITADTKDAERKIADLEKALGDLNTVGSLAAKGLGAITAAGAAMAYAIGSSIQSVGELNDASKALGMSAQNLKYLQQSAQLAGISADELNGSLRRMQANLGDAFIKGAGPAADALKRLGLNAAEIVNLGADEQMKRLADAINQIPTPAERSAVAMDLLGKQGPRLLQAAENTARIKEEMTALGLALSDLDVELIDQAGDSLDELAGIFKAGLAKAAADVAPYIIAIVQEIKNAIKEAGGFEVILKKVRDAIELAAKAAVVLASFFVTAKLAAGAMAIVNGMMALYQAIKVASGAAAVLNAVMGKNPILKIVGALVAIGGAVVAVKAVDDVFDDLDKKAENVKNNVAAQVPLQKEVAAAAQQYNQAQQKALEALGETIAKMTQELQYQKDIVSLGETEAKVRKTIAEENDKLVKVGLELNDQQKSMIRMVIEEGAAVEKNNRLRKEHLGYYDDLLMAQGALGKEVEKSVQMQLSFQGYDKKQIDQMREAALSAFDPTGEKVIANQGIRVQRMVDNMLSSYDPLMAAKVKYEKGLDELDQINMQRELGQITLTLDQQTAMYNARLLLDQQYQSDKIKAVEEANKKLEGFELDRIQRVLMAEQGAIAQSLSTRDQATLQRIGQEERTKAIVATRIEFEKKSELEKMQFGIEQGAQMFSALGAQNKKAFEAAKAFNIANAIMNTYMSVTKALASYPFPFSLIAAGGALAFGMAQVGQIRSQQYSGKAVGGPVVGGQSYMVGERGPELFTPSNAGNITKNSDLQGGATNINFTIVANDTEGFDQLLTSRKGVIQQIISDAMLERGQRM